MTTEAKHVGRRVLRLSFGLIGVVFALLVMVCLEPSPQQSGRRTMLNLPSGYALAGTSDITTTGAFTIYLPLVQNCTMSRLEDFSYPTGAWPEEAYPWANYSYDNGAYKIEMAYGYILAAASPDWGISNEATIGVETWSVGTWSDLDDMHIGLVFGLRQPSWGEWVSWYTFGIDPVHQSYWLGRWTNHGSSFDVVAWGSSSAIVADPTAHQNLEVQHRGTTSTLTVNGTVVDTVITELFTERTAAGVYVFADSAESIPIGFFDNFYVTAEECISEQIVNMGDGYSLSVSSNSLRQ